MLRQNRKRTRDRQTSTRARSRTAQAKTLSRNAKGGGEEAQPRTGGDAWQAAPRGCARQHGSAAAAGRGHGQIRAEQGPPRRAQHAKQHGTPHRGRIENARLLRQQQRLQITHRIHAASADWRPVQDTRRESCDALPDVCTTRGNPRTTKCKRERWLVS